MKKFLLTLLICSISLSGTAQAAAKLTLTPNGSTINEGQAIVMHTQLDHSIPSGYDVRISLRSSNPEMVTISPSSIIYNSGDWAVVKNFTVTAPANGTYNDSKQIFILAQVTSGYSYYGSFQVGATLNVIDTSDPEVPGAGGTGEQGEGTVQPPSAVPINHDPQWTDQVTLPPANPIPKQETGQRFPEFTADQIKEQGAIKKTFSDFYGVFVPENPTLAQKLLGFSLMFLAVCASCALGYAAYRIVLRQWRNRTKPNKKVKKSTVKKKPVRKR